MTLFVQDLLRFGFLQNAVLAGVLAGVACGVVGTFVVVRRISYVAGGIAHSVLGGIGAALYLNRAMGWTWVHPLHGAVAAALLSAVVIGVVSLRLRQREDTVISALWAIGMAAGVLLISRTPGYQSELMSYLFGDILMVTRQDIWLIAALDVVVLAFCLLFYRPLLAVCFDEEHARVRGLPVDAYYLVLLCLVALTVVLLVTVVGLVMVIALLTLPIAVAGQVARRLWSVMAFASGLSVALTLAGQAIAYEATLPAGATIILLAGGVYLLSLPTRHVVGVLRTRRRSR